MVVTGSALIQTHFYPETAVGGFSRVDGSIEFWTRIAALIGPNSRVLDFGAGRGSYIDNDDSAFRRGLKRLKGRVEHIEGCDVDPAVLNNPHLDSAKVIDPSRPLPYSDGSFDLVVASWVLEHIDDPEAVSREFARVTRPGGWIAAVTANRFGYVALAASVVTNRLHARMLTKVQPGRLEHDVFPTRYRMNSRAELQRLFAPYGDVIAYTYAAEPSYHFNSKIAYGLLKIAHKHLPDALQNGLCLFVHRG